MIRRLVVVLAAAVSLAGCGVSTQDEPERLPVNSPTIATTPQVTQRPDPLPTTTTSATPAPGTGTAPST
ncbi:hypothetical protein ACWEKJ_20755 [Amycolatopsis thermoflava]